MNAGDLRTPQALAVGVCQIPYESVLSIEEI
jgi:hypothetical protein